MDELNLKNVLLNTGLIKRSDRIVIGVSGGPDSVALLLLLHGLQQKLNLKLHVAHLDHMLRKGSGKDRKFVEKLAGRLGLPITAARVNINKLAVKGSVEEVARNARLGFFFRVAKDAGAKKIALAHTFDDQAETVLMRILRGAGLSGLSGILASRKIAGFEIIRPLLEVKRDQIEVYLKLKRIIPCRDHSNSQDIYFRNKIRNRLIPLLEKEYNKNIKSVLASLAQSSGSDYDYLNHTALKLMQGMRGRISIVKLAKTPSAIRRLILRQAVAKAQGNTRRLTFKHMQEMEDLLLNRPAGSVVDLPKGLSVLKKPKFLQFCQNNSER